VKTRGGAVTDIGLGLEDCISATGGGGGLGEHVGGAIGTGSQGGGGGGGEEMAAAWRLVNKRNAHATKYLLT
jgi:hypothetical protein